MAFERKRKYEQQLTFAVVMKYVICIARHANRFGMAHTPIKASNGVVCVYPPKDDDDVNQQQARDE